MKRIIVAALSAVALAAAVATPAMAQAQAQSRASCFFLGCLFQNGGSQSYGGQGYGYAKSTKTTVPFADKKYRPGSIIIKTPERALYYVLPDGKAYRYRVGVGREGFQWSGNSKIVRKAEWPDWRPPAEMIKREAAKGHIIPDYMPGGPTNPLGARALYIGGTVYRIHGTNAAETIGGAVSSGCIRMLNNDVIDLYGYVKVGSPVYVYQ
ncbi:MAG: L,D-transpeptidase [Hyphomicrobiales bacterium]